MGDVRIMKIGVIVAMDRERELLREVLAGDVRDVVVAKCGIGKVNATLGTQDMINSHHPDVIISTGVAGAAREDLRPLDVVASKSVAYHDVWCGADCHYGQVQGLPREFSCDDRLVGIARGMEGVRVGLIASGDWFVDSVEKAREIRTHYPSALAFDMESGAIAQVCHLNKCKFISFRIISDNPFSERGWQQYEDFWERLSEGSMKNLVDFLDLL